MTMTKQKLLNKLLKIFTKMEFCAGIEGDMLYVHHMLCTIYIENENDIAISFEMNCEATIAAVIIQQIIDFADRHYCDVLIYEPYVFVDEEDIVMLFGNDARHYYATGEIPETKTDQKKSPVSIEDLKANLKVAIEKEEFERASKLRDRIFKLEKIK